MSGFELNNWVLKFGRCGVVDSAEVVDIYDNGGAVNSYPWPAAAAATTVVSGEAADTATGTGCQEVEVEGVGVDYAHVKQRAEMNGTTPVSLATNMLRVFRVKGTRFGSGETNAGQVDVKHSATVLASISTGFGQSLMAIYTVPVGSSVRLARWRGSSTLTADGTIFFRLDVRAYGSSGWTCKETIGLGGRAGVSFEREFAGWQPIAQKTDVRVRVFGGTDNSCVVDAGFDLLVIP